MILQVPGLPELSACQRKAVSLPFEGSSLVTGGPGTGKTITAIRRTAVLHRSGRPTTMLMYSRVLSAYTHTAVARLGAANIVTTYHKWFHEFWRACYHKNPPAVDRWQIDWMACLAQVLEHPPARQEPRYVVIDEGQDLPSEFYLVLRAAPTYLTVFADDNQRITTNQSTIQEIINRAGITSVVALPTNNRNTRPIAELAMHLRPTAATDTNALTDGPSPRLVHHGQCTDAAEYIARHERDHPDETIGVILHLSHDLKRFHRLLDGRTVNPVQGYLSIHRNGPLADPSFSGPGIKLITAKSAKGLEFDSVFLPELQSVSADPTTDDTRMQMYVLVTRARRNLTLMYTGNGEPAVVSAIPRHLLNISPPT
ncbi:AAA family ATPase [Micromonospora sp. WMMD712]|uniref:AAA family ATPase n=1 Tax=Micromonospora sp. WMMD712 TaxID=3016096 RepID=UPI00249BC224|nr:AAA family ATPase [Micromonospora sp. WMMD712]WFE59528.1 AAA family ATPase [Micromonospora sp. WMMD712]